MRKEVLFAALMAISLTALAVPAAAAPPVAGSTPAADASVRVFVLKYRRVEEAALLIRPHLSESASVTLTPRLNAMTITDREENLKTVAKVIAEFDAPPRGFSFAVKLVRARTDAPAGTIAQEIGGLGAKLKSMFQFNDYALLDSAVIQGVEGRPLSYRLGDEYVLTFSIGAAGSGEELLLSPFALSRMKKDEQGRPSTVPLYRASITVTLNQTLVVGASKEEGSKNALILILLAQETARPGLPGGKSVGKR
ncbi:MAG TPA: secretin N-terminal domain-containing protein [Thermoanaerobaculia bacterium]|nr:secretin N-terminal domain-containing protein [Thermoanaerobaculia bacterium]